MASSARRQALAAAALIFLWLAATAWLRPLMLPDEGRYVGVAWEMLRSGDWLTPTLNGLPYFHKPPLFYWITAASLSVFGMNEGAARAAPLVGAWLGAMAIFLFTRRWFSERAARLTLLALAVQPLFFIGGQFANLDMLVAGCISATIALLAHAALSVERRLPYRRALLAAWAMGALGILAKGLIGAVLPALVVGGWLILRRRWRVLLALLWWPGPLIFLLIAAPWFVAMQLRFAEFLNYFFVVQHFKRFAQSGFNNVQPFWFYPAVLLLFSLPFVPWLARLFGRGYWRDAERGPIRLLMVLWIGLVVLFFSLPQSKLLGYILPVTAPLAMLMADGFESAAQPSARTRHWWQASVAIGAVLCVGAVLAIAIYPARSTREIAAALRDQRRPNEAVVMLGNYYFDLPYYARLGAPVMVVDDWSSPEVTKRDTWRKELFDAGRFAPAQAARTLIEPAALDTALCRLTVSWVIGASATDRARFPLLASAREIARQRDTTLWRVQSASCAQTPSAGSTGK